MYEINYSHNKLHETAVDLLIHLRNLRVMNIFHLPRLLPQWALLSHLSGQLLHLRLVQIRTQKTQALRGQVGTVE